MMHDGERSKRKKRDMRYSEGGNKNGMNHNSRKRQRVLSLSSIKYYIQYVISKEEIGGFLHTV